MAVGSGDAIQEAAEEALRSASGKWSDAAQRLRESIDQDEALREGLLQRSLLRELREAAARLGVGTVECIACGEGIPVDADRCRYCGEEQIRGSFTSVPLAPPRPQAGGPIIRHFTLLTGWILIVLIVILIISLAT